MVVIRVFVRMDMWFAVMDMRMNMDKVIFLQELCIGQKLGGRALSYDPFILIEDIYDIGYLVQYVHVMGRGYYGLIIFVIFSEKVYQVPGSFRIQPCRRLIQKKDIRA